MKALKSLLLIVLTVALLWELSTSKEVRRDIASIQNISLKLQWPSSRFPRISLVESFDLQWKLINSGEVLSEGILKDASVNGDMIKSSPLSLRVSAQDRLELEVKFHQKMMDRRNKSTVEGTIFRLHMAFDFVPDEQGLLLAKDVSHESQKGLYQVVMSNDKVLHLQLDTTYLDLTELWKEFAKNEESDRLSEAYHMTSYLKNRGERAWKQYRVIGDSRNRPHLWMVIFSKGLSDGPPHQVIDLNQLIFIVPKNYSYEGIDARGHAEHGMWRVNTYVLEPRHFSKEERQRTIAEKVYQKRMKDMVEDAQMRLYKNKENRPVRTYPRVGFQKWMDDTERHVITFIPWFHGTDDDSSTKSGIFQETQKMAHLLWSQGRIQGARLNLGKKALGGYSFGGHFAWKAFEANPEEIDGLFIFDSIGQEGTVKGRISQSRRSLLCKWHKQNPKVFLGLSSGLPSQFPEYSSVVRDMKDCGLVNILKFPERENFWKKGGESRWWYEMTTDFMTLHPEDLTWERHHFSVAGGPGKPPHEGGKSHLYYFLKKWLQE